MVINQIETTNVSSHEVYSLVSLIGQNARDEMTSIVVTRSITDIRDHGDWPGDSDLVSISGPLSTWTGELLIG